MDRASGLLTIVGIAGAAAAASVAGGLIALWRPPGTLFLSLALGFAGGVLLATVTFEMLPTALERGSLPLVTGGFLLGMLAVYGFDLYVHRGRLAGDKSAERDTVRRFHRRRRPRGDEVTVLAGGTSVEELIEGLSIGVGSAIAPGTGLLIGIAIAIDNLGESLSIGELIRSESGEPDRAMRRRILGWTALIGAAVLGSALVGWFLLRGLKDRPLAFLLALGAGAMFYLTTTDLLPEAQQRQYQQSGALAAGAGFLVIFGLAQLT
ncbi:MAG TPA: ZIP family metal transporter [Woeseiaceae bacterium]|nr:ZIP family metal transporter [Woeseiaceae bacterium]